MEDSSEHSSSETAENETGEDDTQEEESNSMFKCINCNEAFTGEKCSLLLECLHALCETCLDSWTNSSETTNTNTLLPCPVCKLPSRRDQLLENKLIYDIFLPQNLAEDIENIKCSNHPEINSTDWCDTCSSFICQTCVTAHRQLKPTKDHVIKSKDEHIQTLKETKPQRLHPCSNHPKEMLTVYCTSCKKMTCRDCQLTDHRSHEYLFISEMANDTRKCLNELLQEIEGCKLHLESNIKLLKEDAIRIEQSSKKIREEYRPLLQKTLSAVSRGFRASFNKGESMLQGVKKETLTKCEDLENQLKQIHHCEDFVQRALDVSSDPSLIFTKEHIINQLRRLKISSEMLPSYETEFHVKFCVPSMEAVKKYEEEFSNCLTIKMGRLRSKLPKVESGQFSHETIPNRVPAAQPQHNIQQRLQIPAQPLYKSLHPVTSYQPSQQNYEQSIPHSSVSAADLRGGCFVPTIQMAPKKNEPKVFGHGSLMVPPVAPPVNQCRQPSSSYLISTQPPSYAMPEGPRHITTNVIKGPPTACLPNRTNQPPNYSSHCIFTRSDGHQVVQDRIIRSPARRVPVLTALVPQGHTPQQQTIVNHAPQQQSNNVSWHIPQNDFNKIPTASTPNPNRTERTVVKREAGSDEWFKIQLGPTLPLVPTPPSVSSAPQQSNPVPQSNKTIVVPRNPSEPSPSAPDPQRPVKVPPITIKTEKQNISCVAKEPERRVTSTNVNDEVPVQSRSEDPNEDWCAVCMDGGDLVCCDNCPKVFHIYCHIPALSEVPNETWQCTLCSDVPTLRISGSKRPRPTQLSDQEQMVCERILLELYCQYDSSLAFREPVTRDHAEYYKVIKKPMCLDTIRNKLRSETRYASVKLFVRDIRLVFQNAFKFNSVGSKVYADGMILEEFLETILTKYLPLFAHTNLHNELSSSDESEKKPAKKSRKKSSD